MNIQVNSRIESRSEKAISPVAISSDEEGGEKATKDSRPEKRGCAIAKNLTRARSGSIDTSSSSFTTGDAQSKEANSPDGQTVPPPPSSALCEKSCESFLASDLDSTEESDR